MQSTDRKEFEDNATVMFAGCNLPATPERLEAFWRGLQQMPLSAFVRAIDHVLGPNGPENLQKITTPQIWAIYRQQRASAHNQKSENEVRNTFDAFSFSRTLDDQVAIRHTMPKTADGYIVDLEYLPTNVAKVMRPLWRQWHLDHPGVSEINAHA